MLPGSIVGPHIHELAHLLGIIHPIQIQTEVVGAKLRGIHGKTIRAHDLSSVFLLDGQGQPILGLQLLSFHSV